MIAGTLHSDGVRQKVNKQIAMSKFIEARNIPLVHDCNFQRATERLGMNSKLIKRVLKSKPGHHKQTAKENERGITFFASRSRQLLQTGNPNEQHWQHCSSRGLGATSPQCSTNQSCIRVSVMKTLIAICDRIIKTIR